MQTLLRRLITLGVLFSAAVMNTLLLPAALAVFVVVDLCLNRRMPLTRAYLVISFYLFWECLGVLAAFVVWVFPGPRSPRSFLQCNSVLQRIWVDGFTRAGSLLFSLTPDVQGDFTFGERPFILLARHTSLADTILVSWIVLVRHKIRMRFVMKQELLWDPCLDIVGNRLPNYFVDRNAKDNTREIANIASLARGLVPGEGVVMYPEGTRFSAEKRVKALQRLEGQGHAELLRHAEQMQHVLPPRLAGTMALLENAPGADVVFFAHTGFEGASSFSEFFRGSMIGREVRVQYWAVPASDVPADGAARRQWLYREWLHMDEVVGGWK